MQRPSNARDDRLKNCINSVCRSDNRRLSASFPRPPKDRPPPRLLHPPLPPPTAQYIISFEFLTRKPPCNYWINVNYSVYSSTVHYQGPALIRIRLILIIDAIMNRKIYSSIDLHIYNHFNSGITVVTSLSQFPFLRTLLL